MNKQISGDALLCKTRLFQSWNNDSFWSPFLMDLLTYESRLDHCTLSCLNSAIILSDFLWFFFQRNSLSLIRMGVVAFTPWTSGVSRRFRKIQESLQFFFFLWYLFSFKWRWRESPVSPLLRISMAAFPAESSQCMVASAALILKTKQHSHPLVHYSISLHHYRAVLQGLSNGLSLQSRHSASEVTDQSFILKFASRAGHQHSAQLATYVPSLCGS